MESWLIRLATNQPASRGVETAKYKLPQIQLQLIIITIVLMMSVQNIYHQDDEYENGQTVCLE